MERKIGEIFEYNGEWYQCVKGNTCDECSFSKSSWNCLFDGTPYCSDRSDEIEVIFKKLEKVGEPYEFQKRIIQAYKLYTEPFISFDMDFINTYLNGSDTIDIIIKQNIEVMEEKKLNLKEFNLEAAKSGKPVCTRDGRKARIVCFDAKGDQPIIALVEAKGNKDALIEKVERYFINGHSVFEVRETNNDLMMLPEKKEGWINICRNLNTNKTELDTKDIYNTKEEALQNLSSMTYVTTVKINWEE